MTFARIAGIGSFLPEKVVTNKDLEKTMDTSDEWIRERTGIKRRHVVSDDETTSSIGLIAAQRAMKDAGVSAKEIDLIIVGTATPDKIFPSTACIIQRRLGIKGSAAFDVHAACSGFVYAMDIANRFIQAGGGEKCACHRFGNAIAYYQLGGPRDSGAVRRRRWKRRITGQR